MATQEKSSKSYIAMTPKGAVQRIRFPGKGDVLLGRGGGINGHVGNQVFREWVKERKEDYNLAGSKAEKTKVATDVMDRVKAQNPPGRFLQRESSASGMGQGWWVEVDFNRALAKTSQALREGAPKIRAAHQTEFLAARAKSASSTSTRKRKASVPTTTQPKPATAWPQTVPVAPSTTLLPRPITNTTNTATNTANNTATVVSPTIAPATGTTTTPQLPMATLSRPLMSNREFYASQSTSPSAAKRARVEPAVDVHADTPPLLPTAASSETVLPPPLRLDAPRLAPAKSALPRSHSLAFSDISTPMEDDGEFVNPFLDESEVLELYQQTDSSETKRTSKSNNNNPTAVLGNVSSGDEAPTPVELSREDYRSMAELYDFPSTDGTTPIHTSNPTTTNATTWSTSHHDPVSTSRSGGGTNHEPRDFDQDVKEMWDAVHGEGDITAPGHDAKDLDAAAAGQEPVLVIPWRGGILKRRYGTKPPRSNPTTRNGGTQTMSQ